VRVALKLGGFFSQKHFWMKKGAEQLCHGPNKKKSVENGSRGGSEPSDAKRNAEKNKGNKFREEERASNRSRENNCDKPGGSVSPYGPAAVRRRAEQKKEKILEKDPKCSKRTLEKRQRGLSRPSRRQKEGISHTKKKACPKSRAVVKVETKTRFTRKKRILQEETGGTAGGQNSNWGSEDHRQQVNQKER